MLFERYRSLRITALLLAAVFLLIAGGWVVYNAIAKTSKNVLNSGAVVTNGIECANIAR